VQLHTGKSIEQIEQDFDRDNWMTAAEAKEYGLVDEVLVTNPRKQKKD
jgi:ATP-dependent Clp protease protease subunit